MMNEQRIIDRTKGVIEACEELRATESERLSEHAMIIAYLHIKAIFDEEEGK